jgi:hypothetical protein
MSHWLRNWFAGGFPPKRPLRYAALALSLQIGMIWPVAAEGAKVQPVAPTPVATYHNDNLRTGWNRNETVLTPAAVKSKAFGLLATVTVDDQVNAEPLYIPNVTIPGQGKHNVVYVATVNDTVYAIDADNGAVLLSHNLGIPVPLSVLPGGCPSNGRTVGITSTPVADIARNALYVVTYTFEQRKPVYRIHALALTSLNEKTPATVISSSQFLANGKLFKFSPLSNLQRAALLEANGNIYAAFTSFCDLDPDTTRGLVLGWQANTLKPLGAGKLTDGISAAPNDVFLSTIWMSGFGIAGDESGSLYFVTGNSDQSGTTFSPTTNLEESVVKLSSDLTKVQGYFTPSGPNYGAPALDTYDGDFGAGGVMLTPPLPGSTYRLAVAAGKAGILYLLDRNNLGGYHAAGPDQVLGKYIIGGCWCGSSYFQGADGVGRLVTSGGANMIVWRINTSSKPRLVLESESVSLNTGQDSGFFTSISSNGTQAKSQVIWAIARPVDKTAAVVRLYAFDPSQVTPDQQNATLFTGAAGVWPNTNANANIVPLVANGKVYVGSYKRLEIFGLQGTGVFVHTPVDADASSAAIETPDTAPVHGHVLYGTVMLVDGAIVRLRTRTEGLVAVDTAAARLMHRAVPAVVGHALLVNGEYDTQGTLRAETVLHAKDSPALWQDDH